MMTELFELDETFAGESDEFDERAGRRGPSIRTPSQPVRPPVYTPAAGATSQFVTQNQLRDALGRVSRDVAANKTAIESVTRQANSAVQRLGQVSSRLDTEVKSLRGELQRQSSNSLLLTLMTSGQQKVVDNDNREIGKTAASDMLPLALILGTSGFGGGHSSGSAAAPAADNGMMMALAFMMMGKK